MRVPECIGGSLEVFVPEYVPRNTINLGGCAAHRLYNLTRTVNLNSGKRSTDDYFDHAPLPRRGFTPQPPRAGGVLSTRFDWTEPTVACVILNQDDQGCVAYSPPSRYALRR